MLYSESAMNSVWITKGVNMKPIKGSGKLTKKCKTCDCDIYSTDWYFKASEGNYCFEHGSEIKLHYNHIKIIKGMAWQIVNNQMQPKKDGLNLYVNLLIQKDLESFMGLNSKEGRITKSITY